jgi:hypothetical protein
MKTFLALWKAYWATVPRKARWLAYWAVAYVVCAIPLNILDFITHCETGVSGTLTETYLMNLQWVWIAFMSTPLWIKPLGDWVFKRGRHAEATKETK